MEIQKAFKQAFAQDNSVFAGKPCALCGDPNRSPGDWHSEDYSPPFLFSEPASYAVCRACHGRLHKRFNLPAEEWELFCQHIEAGGYGSEFVALYPPRKREVYFNLIRKGLPLSLEEIRPRLSSTQWWRDLTLDPESLIAAWARPRPWRARPDEEAYQLALKAANPSASEWAMLKYHAAAPRRTVTMRLVAEKVLRSVSPQTANLAYGRFAKRVAENLNWKPDLRLNGSPFWMSAFAEGWQPPPKEGARRDYELVMVPTLVDLLSELSEIAPPAPHA